MGVIHVYILLHSISHCVFLCMTGASPGVEGAGNDSSTSTTMLSSDGHSNTQSGIEQHVKTAAQSEEQQASVNTTCECTKVKEKPPCEQQTGQLVKEVRSRLSVFM